MFNRKRLLAVALASCMLTTGLSGCSSGSGSAEISEAVTLYSTEESSEESSLEKDIDSETIKQVETTKADKETEKESKEKATTEKETKKDKNKETKEQTESAKEATEGDSDMFTSQESVTDVQTASETTSFETTTEETTTEEITTTEEPTTEASNIGLTAVAQVEKYVNVRTEPNTGAEIVGKIYNNCAATILNEVDGEDGEWYYMTSGNVTGYIKAEFFVVGDEAEALRETIGVTFARIVNDYTRVRTTPTLDTMDNIVTMYRTDTVVAVVGIEGDFAKIETDAASTGYVHISCIEMWKEFNVAISLEEEQARILEQQRREEEARIAKEAYEQALIQQSIAASVAESSSIQQSIDQSLYESALQATYEASIAQSIAESASAQQAYDEYIAASIAQSQAMEQSQAVVSSLRNAIITYAKQFVGCPYVHAGRSLTNGTDCSGFTHLVYEQFGVKLGWSPEEQCNQGVRISYTEAQPGDLLFYSNSTSYLGHVAMYIGNGQIVHAANPEFGICIWNMMYREPLFAVRYIE